MLKKAVVLFASSLMLMGMFNSVQAAAASTSWNESWAHVQQWFRNCGSTVNDSQMMNALTYKVGWTMHAVGMCRAGTSTVTVGYRDYVNNADLATRWNAYGERPMTFYKHSADGHWSYWYVK